jgi:hypothetical protein
MGTNTKERPGAFLTLRAAGEMLGLSKRTMRQIVDAGSLEPVVIPGMRRPRYRRADVEKLISGEGP